MEANFYRERCRPKTLSPKSGVCKSGITAVIAPTVPHTSTDAQEFRECYFCYFRPHVIKQRDYIECPVVPTALLLTMGHFPLGHISSSHGGGRCQQQQPRARGRRRGGSESRVRRKMEIFG